MNYTKIKKIAKGWSSFIWIVKNDKRKKFVLKEVREKSPRKDLAKREGGMLLLANKKKVGPKLIEVNYSKNFVVMEYIRGENFFDFVSSQKFLDEVTPNQVYELIKELHKQLLALNEINLSHNQLQVGKNILVKKVFNKKKHRVSYVPVIIDFEKATIKESHKTKNIGQLLSMCFYNPNGLIAKRIRKKLNLVL